MKKAMLFVVSFLFAVSANAATLDLTLAGTGGFLGGATQTINSNNASDVSASGVGLGVTWYSDFVLQSDKNTKAVISFEAIGASLSKHSSVGIQFGDNSPIFSAGESPFSGIFSFSQTVMLTAGTQYFFLLDGIKNVAGYSLNVSAVPIPAALWLFAPALLGFFGLRRKAAQNAAVA
ncbi:MULTISPECIES: hypothetical protein [unclassified Methylophaga]|uniref:hypothetical protein n=1 Tax=unclassified Methylophaga TaxID=2629249 RepID=UPI000C911D15|nr:MULTISPECIES: hypothetical protein [unclassified Methylophaga]MBN47239.1 hypothetical protein [Methylophaga sp.]|tara:strand:- start:34509 stop:35039 length:531 start_codon:yes stop_codon:yes gene_type:complete